MYRGFQLLFRLLLKYTLFINMKSRSSLLKDAEETMLSRVSYAWQTALTSSGPIPWGDLVTSGKDSLIGQIPLSLSEQYLSDYNEYITHRYSSTSDVLTADEFLNAEITPFFVGVQSVFGKAHTLKEVTTPTPILESIGIDKTPESETPSRADLCAMDFSLFLEVYKSILTYLPTTQPKDYEAMEILKDVILRK